MGWIRITRANGSTPDWARELNVEADAKDRLSEGFVEPKTGKPRSQARLDAEDKAGA